MVGHGVGLVMENALDLNMSTKLWCMMVGQWWFGDAWRFLGLEHGIKLKEGWIGICIKFILENLLRSTIQYYSFDASRLVSQNDNDPKHTSKIV